MTVEVMRGQWALGCSRSMDHSATSVPFSCSAYVPGGVEMSATFCPFDRSENCVFASLDPHPHSPREIPSLHIRHSLPHPHFHLQYHCTYVLEKHGLIPCPHLTRTAKPIDDSELVHGTCNHGPVSCIGQRFHHEPLRLLRLLPLHHWSLCHRYDFLVCFWNGLNFFELFKLLFFTWD